MAGPRAPLGTLSQHSQEAAKLIKNPSSSRNANSKKQGKKFATSKESDSSSASSSSDDSSGSGSESDSDASSNSDAVKPTALLAKLKASRTPNGKASQAKTGKNQSVKKSTKASSDASSGSSSDSDSEESGSGSSSDSEAEGDAPKKSKTKATPKSAETVESGDSSDSSDSDTGAKVNKADSGGTDLDTDSSGVSDSESDSEAEAAPKSTQKTANTKPTKEVAQPKAKSSSTALVKANATTTEMDIDSDGGSDGEGVTGSQAVAKQNGNAGVPETLEFLGPSFHLRKATDTADAAEVARIFKDAKSQGKQIWYFTMPADLPIEVIQERTVQVDQLRNGKTVISHNGFDYAGASEEAGDTSIKVLIPNKTGTTYEALNRSIDCTVNFKKVFRFDEQSQVTLEQKTQKPPRNHPEGLKSRFQPAGLPPAPVEKTGDGASPDGDGDVEMAPAPPVETPITEGKKRKHNAEEGSGSAATKKSKKARVDAASKETPIAPPAVPVSSKKGKTQVASSPVISRSAPAPQSDRLPSTQPTPKSTGKAAPSKVTPVMPPPIPGLNGGSKNA
ncbi:DNA-directed RNA polymerase I subunit RPA34.5-domain-containing protein [Echria macrotheca]|uniref:DNA-directed RNA polymerase I subunit RPA34.5-domain-containing protein n=1 Tax=Echria macrotheca TaxID=438768 RepID=A0AAJ0B1A3_9PEZI|nr:DNA-directed RNA polymerase I subunit RPA34.5-domain-containing protein [Echria macrotheca]